MLRWLWQFIRPYKIRLTVAALALIITAGLTLSLGQGVRLMVDQGFSAGSVEGLGQALSFFAVLVVAVSVGAYLRFYMVSWLGERDLVDW